jgi:hypothetical protein
MQANGIVVVKHSTLNHIIAGLNPATGIWRENTSKIAVRKVIFYNVSLSQFQ